MEAVELAQKRPRHNTVAPRCSARVEDGLLAVVVARRGCRRWRRRRVERRWPCAGGRRGRGRVAAEKMPRCRFPIGDRGPSRAGDCLPGTIDRTLRPADPPPPTGTPRGRRRRRPRDRKREVDEDERVGVGSGPQAPRWLRRRDPSVSDGQTNGLGRPRRQDAGTGRRPRLTPRRGLLGQGHLIDPHAPAVAHDQLAVDDHVADAAPVGAPDQLEDGVAAGGDHFGPRTWTTRSARLPGSRSRSRRPCRWPRHRRWSPARTPRGRRTSGVDPGVLRQAGGQGGRPSTSTGRRRSRCRSRAPPGHPDDQLGVASGADTLTEAEVGPGAVRHAVAVGAGRRPRRRRGARRGRPARGDRARRARRGARGAAGRCGRRRRRRRLPSARGGR